MKARHEHTKNNVNTKFQERKVALYSIGYEYLETIPENMNVLDYVINKYF